MLEGELPHIELVNLGVTGYDIRQVATKARLRAPAYEPDLVVYAFFTNDGWETEFMWIGQPRHDAYVAYPVAPELAVLGSSERATWATGHSALARRWQSSVATRSRHAGLLSEPGRWALAPFPAMPESGYWYFDRFAQKLVDTVGAEELLVLTIPPHVAAAELAECDRQIGVDTCAEHLDRITEAEAFCARRGVPVQGALPYLRASRKKSFYFQRGDTAHPNAEGHAVIARALADGIRRLTPPRTAAPSSEARASPP